MGDHLNNRPAEKRMVTVIAAGFTIFATFFGAGNLIFPAYLGVVGGENWWIGFIAFVLADFGLGVLGLAASGRMPQVEIGAFYRPGRMFMLLYGGITLWIAGDIIVVPRTGAVALESGLEPIAPNFPPIVFLVIFFGLACLLTIRPTKVVDIVGKILTPVLLASLIAMFVIGLMNGGGEVRPDALDTGYESLFAFGMVEGYQTFDGLTGICMATILITTLLAKGVTDTNEQTKTILQSGLVAGICLVVIYGGLTLLGVYVSSDSSLLELYAAGSLDRTYLLNYIVLNTLGTAGQYLMSIAVVLATFTTAIGATSLFCSFLERATNGKVKYSISVIVYFIIAFIIAVFSSVQEGSGVEFIIDLATPIVMITTPASIALAALAMFSDKINNDNVYRGAFAATILTCAINYFKIPVLSDFLTGGWNFLTPYGFEWVIPAIVGAVIGQLIKYKGYEPRPYLRENRNNAEVARK